VAGTAGSTLNSVDAAANTVPSLPNAVPPAAPPAPVAPPAAPQVPVKLPTEARPTSSPSPTGPGTDAPSVDGIASSTRDAVGSVTSTGKKTATRGAGSAPNGGGRASVPRSRPDAGASKATHRAIGIASKAPFSIKKAEVAALVRWFARIWPGIPLGGGETGQGWAAKVIEGDLLRPAIADIARLLVPPITRVPSGSPPVGHPATASAPRPASPDASAPADRGTIYLIAIVALLALLSFTIWTELRSVFRPGVR
jgi:hypothetical protein